MLGGENDALDFELADRRDGSGMLLVVSSTANARVRVGDLDRASRRAWLDVEVPGVLETAGWSELAKQPIVLAERVTLLRDHVWLPSGTPVLPLERGGPGWMIEATSPQWLPERHELSVACNQLRFGFEALVAQESAREAAISLDVLVPVLDLYDAPGGRKLIGVVPHPCSGKPSAVSERDGWYRITGELEALIVDVWVSGNQVRKAQPGRLGGCGKRAYPPRLRFSSKASQPFRTSRKAELHVGATPPGQVAARMLHGVDVSVWEEREGWKQVTLEVGVKAPDSMHFWIAAGDLVPRR